MDPQQTSSSEENDLASDEQQSTLTNQDINITALNQAPSNDSVVTSSPTPTPVVDITSSQPSSSEVVEPRDDYQNLNEQPSDLSDTSTSSLNSETLNQPATPPQSLPNLPSNSQQAVPELMPQNNLSQKSSGFKKTLLFLIVLVIVIVLAVLIWLHFKS